MAWDIIRKGPERLQSQFAAGYGMVLNLLYSRSLEEAKAFIDRSFNTYLSEPLVPSPSSALTKVTTLLHMSQLPLCNPYPRLWPPTACPWPPVFVAHQTAPGVNQLNV